MYYHHQRYLRDHTPSTSSKALILHWLKAAVSEEYVALCVLL
jgi:hypothetical protein